MELTDVRSTELTVVTGAKAEAMRLPRCRGAVMLPIQEAVTLRVLQLPLTEVALHQDGADGCTIGSGARDDRRSGGGDVTAKGKMIERKTLRLQCFDTHRCCCRQRRADRADRAYRGDGVDGADEDSESDARAGDASTDGEATDDSGAANARGSDASSAAVATDGSGAALTELTDRLPPPLMSASVAARRQR